jgi:hypothetical protein
MTVRGQRYTGIFLTTSIMLSLLSLIVISVMALFQLLLDVRSENTYPVLFAFTFLPSTVLAWSSFVGRLLFLEEYADKRDARMKLVTTLVLSVILTLFCYFLLLNII